MAPTMKSKHVPWLTDGNTVSWSRGQWWERRGICRCGHRLSSHEMLSLPEPDAETGKPYRTVCRGVLSAGRPKRGLLDGQTRAWVPAVNPCMCTHVQGVFVLRDTRAFVRAAIPGGEHPFNMAVATILPENVLEWMPGQPSCNFVGCEVTGLENVRMIYSAPDRSKSAFVCAEHMPTSGPLWDANRLTADRPGYRGNGKGRAGIGIPAEEVLGDMVTRAT